MTRDVIIGKVKVKIDELTPFDDGLAVALPNANIKPIQAYIDELLDEAAKETLLRSPLHLLSPKDATLLTSADFSNTVTVLDEGQGYVKCPADYLRLYSFKMNKWKRNVTETISEAHPDWNLQSNKYVRGGEVKPVVVLKHLSILIGGVVLMRKAEKCLVFYSTDTNISHFLYIPIQKAEELKDNLIDILVWVCVRKVMEVLKLPNYEIAEKEVQQLLTLENK